METKLFGIIALFVVGATFAWAQSQSISYTFQFSPPYDVSQPGGCANIQTENGQGITGDSVCPFSTSGFDSSTGFSIYLYQGTPNALNLEGGTLTYNGRVWNSTQPKGACTQSQYGPGSTFTDSYSNSFGSVNQGWSGSTLVNGTVTATKRYNRFGCYWELVHTTGSGTEVYNQPQ